MTSRRRWVGLAATASLVIAVIPVTATAASWNDSEWDNATIGTLDCSHVTDGHSVGFGKVLSGTILDTDLATLADVAGVTATADDGSTTPTPSTAPEANDPAADPPSKTGDAYADPLTAEALNDALSADLSGVLTFDVEQPAGAYGQYAVARSDGSSGGSAGLVTDSGSIDLDAGHSSQQPQFATLSLQQLLASVPAGDLSEAVSNLADASLEIGALASSATLDGCDAAWNVPYSTLDREYFIAGLDATVSSDAVSDVGAAVSSAINSEIAGLEDADGSLASTLNGILGATGALPLGLGLGTPTITSLAITADLSPVTDLLGDIPLGTNGALGTVDVRNGTVRVDLAALLGTAYGASDGLNGIAPNTELLISADQVDTLKSAVVDALTALPSMLTDTINESLESADVTLKLSIPVFISLVVGDVKAGSLDVTISHLLGDQYDPDEAKRPAVSAKFIKADCNLPLGLCGTLASLLNTLLDNGLVSKVTDAVFSLVQPLASAVTDAVADATTTTVAGLTTTLSSTSGLVTAAASAVSGGLGGLFGEDGLLSLTVNNQNLPDPSDDPRSSVPAWAAGLPGPQHSPYRSGRFDVSALRIVGAGALLGGIAVDFARSGVGPNGPG